MAAMQMNFKGALTGVGALLVACACLAQAPSAAAATEDHAGVIKSVRGKVRLQGESGGPRDARAGDRVLPADRILTDADGAAGVVLRDGTMLVVGPSSQLELRQFSFDSTTQDGGLLVSLLRGSLRMVTGLIGKANPEAVRVETQTATIGIRGTDFIVQADAQP